MPAQAYTGARGARTRRAAQRGPGVRLLRDGWAAVDCKSGHHDINLESHKVVHMPLGAIPPSYNPFDNWRFLPRSEYNPFDWKVI